MPTELRVVTPTGEKVQLRTYWHGGPCRAPWSYHNALRDLRIAPHEIETHEGGWTSIKSVPETPEDFPDPAAWPTACSSCGTPVPAGHFLARGSPTDPAVPTYQVFQKTVYENPPRELQPGDIFPASWMPSSSGRFGIVMPDGSAWFNGEAPNCPHGHPGGDHACWTVTGTAPKLTIRASIDTGAWHGFVTDGVAAP
jgi:hypothetical protein